MSLWESIGHHLTGDAADKLRREELLGDLLARFAHEGEDGVQARLREWMVALETPFQDVLEKLEALL